MPINRYLPIQDFLVAYPSFSRTGTYECLKRKELSAKKFGGKTLIDTESADVLLEKLPEYKAQSQGERK